MRHIELLTIESYLEEKRELIENANYVIKELHLECDGKIIEMIEEIWKEYFGEGRDGIQENSVRIKYRKKDGGYKVKIIDSDYFNEDAFLENLKYRYKQLVQEKREFEIVDDIKRILSKVFDFTSGCADDTINKAYEIIKYTLTEEARCDYFNNGKHIGELREGEDIFPFKKIGDYLPIYCQKMQCVLFGVHRRIFSNSYQSKQSSDITRFSFYNVKKIIEAITESLSEEKNSGDYKEGGEDFLLLDEILGISLTNIIYWKTKEIDRRELQDAIVEIVPYLAKCRCHTGKNSVAQVLLDYLRATDYNADVIQGVRSFLKKEVKVWNEYYEEVEAVKLCSFFNALKKFSVSDLIDLCKDMDNGDMWRKYIYMEEIAEDNDMIKVAKINEHEQENKIRIPKKNMDSRTWYAYIHKTVFEAIWS